MSSSSYPSPRAWVDHSGVYAASDGNRIEQGILLAHERLDSGASAAPWQFSVEDYGAVGDNSTNDTAAIQAAIDAAVTYGKANEYYAEVVFKPKTYVLSSACTLGGSTLGQAQLTLPTATVCPTTGRKLTLVFRGAGDASAFLHWEQTTPQRSGTVLRTTLTGQTADGTYGSPSVIGGPNSQSGFSNVLVVVDGITIMAPVNPTLLGFDFYKMAQANIVTACAIVAASPAGSPVVGAGNDLPTADTGMGLRMPGPNNNDNCNIGVYSCEGFYWGVGISDHTTAQRVALIYCHTAIYCYGISNRMHGASILYASAEACHTGIESGFPAGGRFPLDIGRLDVENIGTQLILDSDSTLCGDIHYQDVFGGDPVVTGGARLRLIDNSTDRGVQTAPSVPSSTVALVNPFWRDCAVSVSGGTVTAIAVTGTATGLTSGTVIVPSGKSITLTYSVAPSWVWIAL